jgi:hypothetical protein
VTKPEDNNFKSPFLATATGPSQSHQACRANHGGEADSSGRQASRASDLRHHGSKRAGRANHEAHGSSGPVRQVARANHSADSLRRQQAARATQSLDRRRGHGRGQPGQEALTSPGRVTEEATSGTVRGRKESGRGSRSHVNGPKGSGRRFEGHLLYIGPQRYCLYSTCE